MCENRAYILQNELLKVAQSVIMSLLEEKGADRACCLSSQARKRRTMTKIKELKPKMAYESVYILNNHSICKTKKGDDYLKGNLSDSSGSIEFKMWNIQDTFENLTDGGLVKVTFVTDDSYGNSMQLKLSGIWPITVEEAGDAIKDIVAFAEEDPDAMFKEINDTIDAFTDEELKTITRTILTDPEIAPRFYMIPGGMRMHHACIHGLLKHTLGVLRVAKGIANAYPEGTVNKDLLYAGAILHDIGKIEEFCIGEFGNVTEYSVEGNLFGHLFIGANIIDKTCEKLGIQSENRLLLKHMILSHHEKAEMGAVKTPSFLEASLLAHADMIDATTDQYLSSYEYTEPGTFTWSGKDKKVYTPGFIK